MAIESQGGSDIVDRLRCLLAIGLLAACLWPATGPASALLYGGPIIDACVYGNKEFFPGQTAPILVLVQNGGYLESLYGYQTPPQLLQQGSLSYSAGSNYSAGSSQVQAAGYQAAAGLGGVAGAASATGASFSQEVSSSYYNYYQTGALGDFQVNTGTGVRLAATTALGLTCQLTCGNAPLAIVSGDRMLVGSLAPGQTGGDPFGYYSGGLFGFGAFGVCQPMEFWIRVDPLAQPGHYQLPLIVTYKRLADEYSYESVFGPVLGYNNYVQETQIILLDIVIMEKFDLVLTAVTCTDMVPGVEGLVCMKVTNVGGLPVEHAIAYITSPMIGPPQEQVNYPLYYQLLNSQAYNAQQPKPVQQSMLVPVQNSQYLGHVEPGEAREVRFKVSVSDDAEEGDFPLSAVVSYKDPWDVEKSSNVETFGVHVEPEMRFKIDPGPVEIKCGRSCVANLTLTNSGSLTARDAIVRMNALDPFTVSYDTMYLGDMVPGENVSTRYGIKVEPDAVPGDYYVTLEVKYYDSQDNPHVTKIIRKAITVLPPPSIWDLLLENWPLVIGLALLVAIGLAYMGLKWMRRRKRPPASKAIGPVDSDRLIPGGKGDNNM